MMDVLDANAEDVRLLQATRHGEVLTPVELIGGHSAYLREHVVAMRDRMSQGASLGSALVHDRVPTEIRQELLGTTSVRSSRPRSIRHQKASNHGTLEDKPLPRQHHDCRG